MADSKTMQVQFKRQSSGAATCGIGVSVSRDKFADVNELDNLLTFTELDCTLECDPAQAVGEPEGQTKLMEDGFKLSCIARTQGVHLDRDKASFNLQIQRKGNEEAELKILQFSERVGKLTIKRLAQIEETGAE